MINKLVKNIIIQITGIFLITSCIETPVALRNDVIYIGDSNCTGLFVSRANVAPNLAGISNNCQEGRKLEMLPKLPAVEVVFLALGMNDMLEGVPVALFGSHLTELLGTTDADVYCVLPVVAPHMADKVNIIRYRDEMLNRCTNTISPSDYGVVPEIWDGIHWSEYNHRLFVPAIKDRL